MDFSVPMVQHLRLESLTDVSIQQKKMAFVCVINLESLNTTKMASVAQMHVYNISLLTCITISENSFNISFMNAHPSTKSVSESGARSHGTSKINISYQSTSL